MTITVNLPPQAEAKVQAEAARQQITPEAYVAHLVNAALPEEEADAKRERSLALLRSVADIGDEEEQRETFATLQTAIDEDRLSDRKRFG